MLGRTLPVQQSQLPQRHTALLLEVVARLDEMRSEVSALRSSMDVVEQTVGSNAERLDALRRELPDAVRESLGDELRAELRAELQAQRQSQPPRKLTLLSELLAVPRNPATGAALAVVLYALLTRQGRGRAGWALRSVPLSLLLLLGTSSGGVLAGCHAVDSLHSFVGTLGESPTKQARQLATATLVCSAAMVPAKALAAGLAGPRSVRAA